MASVPVVSDVSSVAVTTDALSIPFDEADAESTVSTVVFAAEPDVPHEASTPAQTMTAAVVATTDRIFFQAIRSVPFLHCPNPHIRDDTVHLYLPIISSFRIPFRDCSGLCQFSKSHAVS